MTKPTNWYVRPAKTLISLGIRPVWSESLLSAWRKLGSSATHWAHSEDSDQTRQMPRLIWVFAGRTCHFVGFITRRLILWTDNIFQLILFLEFRQWMVADKNLQWEVHKYHCQFFIYRHTENFYQRVWHIVTYTCDATLGIIVNTRFTVIDMLEYLNPYGFMKVKRTV